MCKATDSPVIETYFNYDHYPGIVDPNNRAVGLSDQSVRLNNGILTCFARRQISMPSISDHFYDLNNPYYLLVAKGPLKGIRKQIITFNLN